MSIESPKGAAWYKLKGMVSLTIHIPKWVRDAYKKRAKRQDRSLQYVVRKVLEKNAPKR